MTTINIASVKSVVVEAAEQIQLEHHEQFTLPNMPLSLRVLKGTAWITSQAEDHILQAGKQITIPRQAHASVIGAISHETMIFELRKL